MPIKTNIPPKSKELHKVSVILQKDQSKITLAQYHHHTLFAPTESTLRRAIRNNHLITFPGLTHELLHAGLSTSVATARGHLHQERQNLQSTKNNNPSTTLLQQATSTSPSLKHEDDDKDYFPSPETPNVKTKNVIYAVIDTRKLGQASMDLTGKFPYISRRGNQYILVGYHYDANYIAAVPVKRRTAGEMTKGWEILHRKFSRAGSTPTTYVMDNETSKELIKAITNKNVNYQLAPPHMHRTNSAERAIQTFKNHFTAGLNVCNKNFPTAEWDYLLPQAEITLNLLRSARVNPKLSAYAYLFGNFDYNATPMAPPGTKVVVHDKPGNRGSWALHGTDGWYIGPSLHHYRCVQCFIPSTKAVRDCDTVVFIPETIPFPEATADDHLKQAATDIIRILTKRQRKTHFPNLEMGDVTKNALLRIAKILNRATPVPALQLPSVKKVTFSADTKHNADHRVLKSPVSKSTANTNNAPSISTANTNNAPSTIPTS